MVVPGATLGMSKRLEVGGLWKHSLIMVVTVQYSLSRNILVFVVTVTLLSTTLRNWYTLIETG